MSAELLQAIAGQHEGVDLEDFLLREKRAERRHQSSGDPVRDVGLEFFARDRGAKEIRSARAAGLMAADAARAAASPEAARYTDAGFAPVRDGIEKRGPVRAERLRHPYFQRAAPASLVIEEVETLWAAIAERDDWSLFEAKLAAIADMRDALSISCHQSVVAGA